MIVAVTGASGFVGGHMARALARRGHAVHAFGQRPASALVAPIPGYRSWDVRTGLVAAPSVDVVVHCAALVGDWGPESAYYAVNVAGTRAVLDTFPSARVVHMSSTSVYSDRQPRGVLDETAPTGDCRYSAYGRTKAAAERMVLAKPDTTVLRPHMIYGPGDSTLLPRVLAARRLGTLLVPGHGRNLLSVTHIDNLADAVISAVERPEARGVFNVADATTATLDELLGTLLARVGAPTRLVHVPGRLAWRAATTLEWVWPTFTPPRGPRITRYVVQQLVSEHTLDIGRAREMLHYSPRVDFRTGTMLETGPPDNPVVTAA